MGKWKKWLSAGLFTAMLGTAIIAGPTADVSANAGNIPVIYSGHVLLNKQKK